MIELTATAVKSQQVGQESDPVSIAALCEACGSPLTPVTKQCPKRHAFALLRAGYVPRHLLTVEELEQRSLPLCAAAEIEAACARRGEPRRGPKRVERDRRGSQHEQLRLPVDG